MSRLFLLCIVCISVLPAAGQNKTVSVFAHNDYEKPVPFFTAYHEKAGYIEADVFLREGNLLVAHAARELDKEKTLETLYLLPLLEQTMKNGGFAYEEPERPLTLIIDLKTEGVPALDTLVKKLQGYMQLTNCPSLQITISGNVPQPALWQDYPGFIHFDGRPGILYTTDQLRRINLVSASFKSYSSWKGRGSMPAGDRRKIESVIREAHAVSKPIRFWATPDFENAWRRLVQLGVDVINTDDVEGLSAFLKEN